ncbi:MAG: selenocysteine-specific translation elongation factor [Limnohabitans sp.]|nr:selenocysteine-specific translation elongation factor [Limnohabitans sp.]
MIIATAGHVDHGKTSLIEALTGVKTDTLVEEKKRGMTIDLGFAYLDALDIEPQEPLGFVDVPGHQDFIKNMLAGVAGVDAVMLVVAADDAVMPQTLEHLAIADFLQISNAVVVLTKVDRVDQARIEEVKASIQTLLAPTRIADAPFFPVCALSGQGVAELKTHLFKLAKDFFKRPPSGNFRLAIDRHFLLSGAGLVVTGTVMSGTLAVGDEVQLLGTGLHSRVRSIHAQNKKVNQAQAGQRCAINLSGADITREHLQRGQWLVKDNTPPPQLRMDALFRMSSNEVNPFRHLTPVHLHLGTGHTMARVAVLQGVSIEPGAQAMVQLVLHEPMGAVAGDRFILRDSSAQRTIGGGRILDVFAPAKGRSKLERLKELDLLVNTNMSTALVGLMAINPKGVKLQAFADNHNLRPNEAEALFAQVAMKKIDTPQGQLAFSLDNWVFWCEEIKNQLLLFHQKKPALIGPFADAVLNDSSYRLPRPILLSVVNECAREGLLIKRGNGVGLPSHMPQLEKTEKILWEKLSPLIEAGQLQPPSLHILARDVVVDVKKVEATLKSALRCGYVIRVSEKHYYLPAYFQQLLKIAYNLSQDSPDQYFTVADFRDRSGIGRNVSIEIMECLNHLKYTRRVGDKHLANPALKDALTNR